MALNRIWIGSPNHSGRSASVRLIVLHSTEGFTGPNGMYDCGYYFQGDVGASSHVVIDNFHPGSIVECVSRPYSSWTQCNYNSQAISVEQCGYAHWTRDYWLNEQENLLRNTAQWIAEEAAHFGIPIVKLSSSQAQGSGKGVCYHSDLGSSGCGHSDPGAGYPVDVVLEWAKGGAPSTPEKEAHEMPTVLVPPRRDVGWSLDRTDYTGVGVFADCGRLGATVEVKMRIALHKVNGGWQVHDNVVLNSSRPKWSTGFPKDKIDSIGFYRYDDTPIDVYPNVAM